ncbi:hypothetical protein [Bdellovibrio sp. ArHS]|uniref:hypothetical protein n=1 Tax=Bdellovibrio sp. ArHS TaxID=1569284 RepID=UPI000A65D028|nr:hypothetical protein [Bdellovibrio sp. ArHS]
MHLSRLVFVLFFFSTLSATAAYDLPKNLNKGERQRALEILGFGSAAKILDNPYPLGGYTGVELGLASEYIPAEDLSNLGSQTTDKGEINYLTLTFGKGLYYNVDTHVYFTPALGNGIQTYGGQVRWGFYEASFFPLTLSAILSGGGANFSNLINVNTLGVNLIATVAMDNVAIYFGGGRVRAIGTFIGGTDGITDDQNTVEEDIVQNHTVFGINIDVSKFFLALEIDRYADSVYSGKLGYRF